MSGLVIGGWLQQDGFGEIEKPCHSFVRVRLVQAQFDPGTAGCVGGDERQQRMRAIGVIGVQLERLACVQEDGEIPGGAVGLQAKDLREKGNLGQHIADQKVDRDRAQRMAKVGGGNGFAINGAIWPIEALQSNP